MLTSTYFTFFKWAPGPKWVPLLKGRKLDQRPGAHSVWYAEIADFIYCKINGIASSFYLILSEAYSEPCKISKIGRFAKVVNGWIPFWQKVPC